MRILRFFICVAAITSCEMVKEVDIELPDYPSQMVLECYLEKGKPYQAHLSRSKSYFQSPEIYDIRDAQFMIFKNNREITLDYKPSQVNENNKYINYYADDIVEGVSTDTFRISISDKRGRVITAKTTFIPVIPVDSIEIRFNQKSKALALVNFTDDPEQTNYYRITIHNGKISNKPKLDFSFSDEIFDSQKITLGTGYDFEKGDTVIASLYHLEQKYYDFLNSVEKAKNANYNPFAQPTAIKSAVKGGIGVFTGLSYDRKMMVID